MSESQPYQDPAGAASEPSGSLPADPDLLVWAVETSRDGDRWRFFGKAWTRPGEPLLIHGLPRFVRYRQVDPDRPWSRPLERTGDEPLARIELEVGSRQEIWPEPSDAGLPVLLPPAEEGRLIRFQRSGDSESWTWVVEFRGRRHRS